MRPAPRPTEPQVAIVRPIPGEPTTFEVASKSEPGQWHRVDIAAWGGCGECACRRWQTVCWPLIRDTHSLPPSRRCRHLRAAREMALNIAIQQRLKEHPTE
jgi:hypothetical protein